MSITCRRTFRTSSGLVHAVAHATDAPLTAMGRPTLRHAPSGSGPSTQDPCAAIVGPTASRTLILGAIALLLTENSVVSGPIFVSAAQVHAPSDWLRR